MVAVLRNRTKRSDQWKKVLLFLEADGLIIVSNDLIATCNPILTNHDLVIIQHAGVITDDLSMTNDAIVSTMNCCCVVQKYTQIIRNLKRVTLLSSTAHWRNTTMERTTPVTFTLAILTSRISPIHMSGCCPTSQRNSGCQTSASTGLAYIAAIFLEFTLVSTMLRWSLLEVSQRIVSLFSCFRVAHLS